MPYMSFSQYTGDTSNIEADIVLPRQKLLELGASRVSAAIALTGEHAGSFTLASTWDTADGYFEARPQVLADPEIRALMQARGMAPVQTSFAELYAETGSAEGKYAVSVIASVGNPDPSSWQPIVDAASSVMLDRGVNGLRFTRAFAAGQQSGLHAVLAYVDSLDHYIAASAAAAADSGFQAAMAGTGSQIMMRQFNRVV